jgi:hypothetical protein
MLPPEKSANLRTYRPPATAFLGEASCFAETACRNLLAMVLRLQEAGLQPSDELATLVEDVCEAAEALTALADHEGARSANLQTDDAGSQAMVAAR